MARKRFTTEKITRMPIEAEVELSKGQIGGRAAADAECRLVLDMAA